MRKERKCGSECEDFLLEGTIGTFSIAGFVVTDRGRAGHDITWPGFFSAGKTFVYPFSIILIYYIY